MEEIITSLSYFLWVWSIGSERGQPKVTNYICGQGWSLVIPFSPHHCMNTERAGIKIAGRHTHSSSIWNVLSCLCPCALNVCERWEGKKTLCFWHIQSEHEPSLAAHSLIATDLFRHLGQEKYPNLQLYYISPEMQLFYCCKQLSSKCFVVF